VLSEVWPSRRRSDSSETRDARGGWSRRRGSPARSRLEVVVHPPGARCPSIERLAQRPCRDALSTSEDRPRTPSPASTDSSTASGRFRRGAEQPEPIGARHHDGVHPSADSICAERVGRARPPTALVSRRERERPSVHRVRRSTVRDLLRVGDLPACAHASLRAHRLREPIGSVAALVTAPCDQLGLAAPTARTLARDQPARTGRCARAWAHAGWRTRRGLPTRALPLRQLRPGGGPRRSRRPLRHPRAGSHRARSWPGRRVG
jgi:hypothetical protein